MRKLKSIKSFLNVFFIISLVTVINFNSIVFAYTMDDYPLNYSIETRVTPDYMPNDYHKPVKDTTDDYEFILYFFDPNNVVFNMTNFNTTSEMKNVYIHYRIRNIWRAKKIEDIAAFKKPAPGQKVGKGNSITPLWYPNVQEVEAYMTWTLNGEHKSKSLLIRKSDTHGPIPLLINKEQVYNY